MEKGLVSIITPCYNGEGYLNRYFESIMNQTYPNIEIIFINDGSRDKTEEIAIEYGEKLKQRGYAFTYIYQENAGQAAAINKGLKLFKGEYLTWPDSDDTLTNDAIEKKVQFLKENNSYAFVRNPANIIDSDNGAVIGTLETKHTPANEKIFEDLIFVNDIWFVPGCYMVKTEEFLKVNKKREIYISRGGQNWQMLLPMACYFRCGYLDEKLCNYYYRNNSHSHIVQADKLKELERVSTQKDILINTLDTLDKEQEYKKSLDVYYEKRKLEIAYKYKDKELSKNIYYLLKKDKSLDFKTRIKILMIKYEIIDKIIIILQKFKRKLVGVK